MSDPEEVMEAPEWTLQKKLSETESRLEKATIKITMLEHECKESWNLRAEAIRAKEEAEKVALQALAIIAWLIKDVVR